nr:MAG: tryptophan synthase subunit alpha [Bacillota bacterium]
MPTNPVPAGAPRTRIGRRLADLRARGEKGLIVYLVAGDPDPETSLALPRAVAEAGADVIELGVPFSDPLADGPVIQAGTARALRAGMTPAGVLGLAARLRAGSPAVPLALMTYVNPVLRIGYRRFCAQAAAAGVDGLIVPDLPHEEAGELREAARAEGLDLIPLVAPTTPPERVAAIVREAGGFVYCVSLTGVTGPRETLPEGFIPLVAEVRRHTELPVAVGFGIATPAQAARVARVADGVIVGSALVRLCGEGLPPERLVEEAAALVRALKAALRAGADDQSPEDSPEGLLPSQPPQPK